MTYARSLLLPGPFPCIPGPPPIPIGRKRKKRHSRYSRAVNTATIVAQNIMNTKDFHQGEHNGSLLYCYRGKDLGF